MSVQESNREMMASWRFLEEKLAVITTRQNTSWSCLCLSHMLAFFKHKETGAASIKDKETGAARIRRLSWGGWRVVQRWPR